MESLRILMPGDERKTLDFLSGMFCKGFLGDLDHQPMARDMLGFSLAVSVRR